MKPFIILGNPRTGTTLLETTLRNHPRAFCFSEILHPNERIRKRTSKNVPYLRENPTLDDIIVFLEARIWPLTSKEAVGFKMTLPQVDHWNLWEYFKTKDINILMTTRNPIASFVSYLQSRDSGVISVFKPEELKPQPPVEVVRHEFYGHLKRNRLLENKALDTFKNIYTINYNESSSYYKRSMYGVFRHLGLPIVTPKAECLKQGSWHVKSRIKNFDEFANQLEERDRYLLEGL